MTTRCLIIAEIGPNHNGDLTTALRMVEEIALAGADIAKFQTFTHSGSVVSRGTPLASYMERAALSKDQNHLLDTIKLSPRDFEKLALACRSNGIEFMSTPFDVASVGQLVELGVQRIKLPSGEITNPFLIEAAAKTGLPLIVSTGMATIGEIAAALELIEKVRLASCIEMNADATVLLQCTSTYPTDIDHANVLAMDALATSFQMPIGFSDHTIGPAASAAAVARGAKVIEKHVTFDTSLPGPDHAASLPLSDLPYFVKILREVERSLGSSLKLPLVCEAEVARVARRSLAAAVDIRQGQVFELSDLTALRPATGISPMRRLELLGRRAVRSYSPGELIDVTEVD